MNRGTAEDLLSNLPAHAKKVDDISEEQLNELGGSHLSVEPDRDVSTVVDGVPTEKTVYDDDAILRLNYLIKDGDLILHVWRGAGVPDHYWGSGKFGLALQASLLDVFPVDTFHLEYVHEMLSYFAVLRDGGKRVPPIPETRLQQVAERVVERTTQELAG